MSIERKILERQATLALAAASASGSPDYLREMAWAAYGELAWMLQWDSSLSHSSEAGLLTWPEEYRCATDEFLVRLPDGVKTRCPVDVFLARELARSIDQHGHSADFRRECATSLYRTLWRLLDYAEEHNIEIDWPEPDGPFVLFEKYGLLVHLASVIDAGDPDDSERDWADDEFEIRSTNHGAYH